MCTCTQSTREILKTIHKHRLTNKYMKKIYTHRYKILIFSHRHTCMETTRQQFVLLYWCKEGTFESVGVHSRLLFYNPVGSEVALSPCPPILARDPQGEVPPNLDHFKVFPKKFPALCTETNAWVSGLGPGLCLPRGLL